MDTIISVLISALVLLIAAQHLLFLLIEMFLWTKPIGLQVFRQSLAKAEATKVMAANQGLYNGFLSAGLIWAYFESDFMLAFKLKVFFLACVLVAGLYGAYSVNRRIFWIQGLPALVALGLLILKSTSKI